MDNVYVLCKFKINLKKIEVIAFGGLSPSARVTALSAFEALFKPRSL